MELINFLKKYSTIPGDFIDDFHKLIYNNNEEFKINLDIAVKWLGVRKDSLKRTLLTYYNNDKKTHFIIKKKYDGTPGKPDETIMLSTDCFKRLCMRSESPKAEEVRSYYIQLEKLVDKYKNHIIYSMEQKIKQLENNQKPIVNYKSGVIYVFKTDQTIEDLYKVGKSDN